jgi:drug/metabolite transporter (DMT)-like permease
MTGLTLALVLVAAFFHAAWNLMFKRLGGAAPLVWLCSACATAFSLPLAVAYCLARGVSLGPADVVFMAVSGVINLLYFLALQRAYREGDLSVVYPLARGTGPALTVLASTVLFQESPTPVACAGVALILLGVVGLAWGGSRERPAPLGRSVGLALLTGGFVAGYTLWDKAAVSVIGVPPIVLFTGAMAVKVVLLGPLARREWPRVRGHWREERGAVLAVSAMLTVSYVLVLVAFSMAPVSYVAPAREVSILFGAILGAGFLGEGSLARRIAAAAFIVCGVVLLGVG